MHMEELEEMIRKIVDDGDRKEMERLSDILVKVSNMVYEYDEKKGNEIFMEIYQMAYGKRLTDSMKREWVKQMKPVARWTEDEIRDVANNYAIDMPVLSFYVIMNMMYSDMSRALGTGDDEQSLMRYIDASNGWYYDSDATNTEEAKLFCYKKSIVD